ncbi:MAG: 16S rRNA (cytidine(1402)-2'-O)-methyltransferase [Deltaproteobacteria bacterium]|nr:16S rRNA (cytidine(1402)-2'-O)-methyltransferase [Deltaproteobacteria bacterium]
MVIDANRICGQEKTNYGTSMAAGRLYIIATPIGNLEDITLRALRVLGEVDLVAAEDTRTTGRLLSHYDIKKPLTSYFEHNEQHKTPQLLDRLEQGLTLALVTDGGTPCISDPGYRLVAGAIERSIPVEALPGACAAVNALCVAGLPVHRFAFEGFLPPKTNRRRKTLEGLAGDDRTLIFYESPHRIGKSLEDMLAVLGDRRAVLAREQTKMHEEVIRGRLADIVRAVAGRTLKGEITIVIEGCRAHD